MVNFVIMLCSQRWICPYTNHILMSLVDSMLNKLVVENFVWKYKIVHQNFINGLCL
jgi:hypothetical protein